MNYWGIPVVEIQPFARERRTFKGVRWLAILDSTVLVFGTVDTTQIELNRYLLHNHADEALLRRLARLHGKDQTWCLLAAPIQSVVSLSSSQEIHDMLAKLSPELAELAQSGSELALGVHYGRRVDFEYEVTFASAGASPIGPDSFRPPSVKPAKSESLLPALNPTMEASAVHGHIALSPSRYKEWLAQIKRAEFLVNEYQHELPPLRDGNCKP
jgi:hypothetical protein